MIENAHGGRPPSGVMAYAQYLTFSSGAQAPRRAVYGTLLRGLSCMLVHKKRGVLQGVTCQWSAFLGAGGREIPRGIGVEFSRARVCGETLGCVHVGGKLYRVRSTRGVGRAVPKSGGGVA